MLRNRWGMSKDTVVTIDAIGSGGIANPYVEILTASSNFEGVGTYSQKDTLLRDPNGKITGAENPLKIRIAENCPNDYLIRLNVTVTCGNGLDDKDGETYITTGIIEFWVRNGVVLMGQINEDQIWTKDNYYIIPSSLYIAEGVTVTVEPGTQIQFWSDDPEDPYADSYIAYLQVAGNFIVNGTEEEPVSMFPSEMMPQYEVCLEKVDNGKIELNYTNVVNATLDISLANCCYFTKSNLGNILCKYISSGTVKSYSRNYIEYRIYHSSYAGCFRIEKAQKCIFDKITSSGGDYTYILKGAYEVCSFIECGIIYGRESANHAVSYKNCLFIGHSQEGFSSYVPFHNYTVPPKGRISNVVNNPETQTAYILLEATTVTYGFDWGVDFAEYIGAYLACIETQEELTFIREQVSAYGGIIGVKNGEQNWINGTPIGSFIPVVQEGQNPFGYLHFNGEEIKVTFATRARYILEIPYHKNGAEWTFEEVNDIFNEFTAKGLDNAQFKGNAIINNFNEGVENWFKVTAQSDPTKKIGLGGNYWGTTDIEMIERQIVDFDDYSHLGDIIVGEYLTTPPENIFPFVTDAYLLNSNGERSRTVGNERVTFVVEFNRDMDTSMPLRVRFGAAKPYADYEVEGNFVSARRWEGTYTLKTTIENGNQVINVENGRAADDHWLILCESAGRFQFEIDTTAAQAMIMQAEATETGIKLTWMQDDFDTIAGYNVYRSESEDGFYQRLNDYVLSADTTEFFDDTVEPGKRYYYNFTVVKTDLSESTPSGKVNVMSFDTMAPDIYHSPVRTAYTGSNLVVGATITDNLQITEAKLWYRSVGGEWKFTVMTANNSRYSGIISAQELSLNGLEYYIDAFDGVNHTYKGTAENPYVVTVKQAVDKNSLGDVDGDGVITIKDALMLLQAANDLLNLTEEQFLRADINGDKTLSAAEALLILQYVSGKITTITA